MDFQKEWNSEFVIFLENVYANQELLIRRLSLDNTATKAHSNGERKKQTLKQSRNVVRGDSRIPEKYMYIQKNFKKTKSNFFLKRLKAKQWMPNNTSQFFPINDNRRVQQNQDKKTQQFKGNSKNRTHKPLGIHQNGVKQGMQWPGAEQQAWVSHSPFFPPLPPFSLSTEFYAIPSPLSGIVHSPIASYFYFCIRLRALFYFYIWWQYMNGRQNRMIE